MDRNYNFESISLKKSVLLSVVFLDPNIVCDSSSLGDHALHILRHEILNCLNLGNTNTQENYWSATLDMLAGIDLMGNIYSKKSLRELSDPVIRQSNFVTFCRVFDAKCGGMNVDQRSLLHIFRNTFVHNLGLTTFDNEQTQYHFGLSVEKESQEVFTPEREESLHFVLNIYHLHDVFERMVNFLEDYLLALPASNFPELLEDLGMTVWRKLRSGPNASMIGNYELIDG